MNRIVGIDLGTTNSCVAIIIDGNPVLIPNAEGQNLTPSVVAFVGDEVFVGRSAQRQALLDPPSTVTSIKRILGRKFSEIKEFVENAPYKIIGMPDDSVRIVINDKYYTPQEISALILQKLKFDAEEYLGCEITEAVITVPARFTSAELKATREAAALAGLIVRRIISEPTSAFLALGLNRKNGLDEDLSVVVFDLGGGSLDISVIEFGDGVYEVKLTAGDLNLGGDDFDFVIAQWLANTIKDHEGVDLSSDSRIMFRLKEAAEKAKIKLSESGVAKIELPFISINSVIKDISYGLTKETFEALSRPLIDKCLSICKKVSTKVQEERLLLGSISELAFVGGSTRMPFIMKYVSEVFNIPVNNQINPDEVVGLGAAIQAGVLEGNVKNALLLDTTSHDLGIEVFNRRGEKKFLPIIYAHTIIPTKKKTLFLKHKNDVLLDQLIVNENKKGSKGMDIEWENLICDISVHNETISYSIPIIESNGVKNTLLELLKVEVPQVEDKASLIEIYFDIDANGQLRVKFEDKSSDITKRILVGRTSPADEDFKSKVIEFRSAEKKKRELIVQTKTIKLAQNRLSEFEKQMNNYRNNLSEKNRKQMVEYLDLLKLSIREKDVQQISSLYKSIDSLWQLISQEIYLAKQEGSFIKTEFQMNQPVEIFISYSHNDEEYKKKIVNSLSALKRLNLINIWNDRDIMPGTIWEENGIYKNLEKAQIIIVLISSDFVASDYCFDNEIKKALERHKLKQVIVLPVIVRPTHWSILELSKFQALPKDAKAITLWENEDEALENIAEGIGKIVDSVRAGFLNQDYFST